MTENKTIFRAYQLKHSGPQWDLWLQGWQKYPTLKTDCNITKDFKARAREGFVNKLRKLAV